MVTKVESTITHLQGKFTRTKGRTGTRVHMRNGKALMRPTKNDETKLLFFAKALELLNSTQTALADWLSSKTCCFVDTKGRSRAPDDQVPLSPINRKRKSGR